MGDLKKKKFFDTVQDPFFKEKKKENKKENL